MDRKIITEKEASQNILGYNRHEITTEILHT